MSTQRHQNKRRHLRIKSGVTGCIRFDSEEQHQVKILDYSLSGLRISTPLMLAGGTVLEVSTCFAPNAENEFHPALVVAPYETPRPGVPGQYGLKFRNMP